MGTQRAGPPQDHFFTRFHGGVQKILQNIRLCPPQEILDLPWVSVNSAPLWCIFTWGGGPPGGPCICGGGGRGRVIICGGGGPGSIVPGGGNICCEAATILGGGGPMDGPMVCGGPIGGPMGCGGPIMGCGGPGGPIITGPCCIIL